MVVRERRLKKRKEFMLVEADAVHVDGNLVKDVPHELNGALIDISVTRCIMNDEK